MKFSSIKEEKKLIKDCIKQNRKAQKDLYFKYKDAMYSICYRITGNYDEASDALQEGFINVFSCLENFNGKSTLGAWIKTIIVRAALNKLSKITFIDFDDIEISAAYELDDCLSGELLEKAILELSPGYRSVFNLIEVEGYSHNEAAKLLGITTGTTKSQLFKAKKELKKKLYFLKNN